MHFFEFLIVVIALGTLGSMFNSWMRQKDKQSDLSGAQSDTRIDDLEKRVQVLERIVTDKAEKLKDDINNL